jgi:hypothetical protein
MLSVPNTLFMMIVIILNDIMLSVVMLNAIMLSVVMLNAIILNVVAPLKMLIKEQHLEFLSCDPFLLHFNVIQWAPRHSA